MNSYYIYIPTECYHDSDKLVQHLNKLYKVFISKHPNMCGEDKIAVEQVIIEKAIRILEKRSELSDEEKNKINQKILTFRLVYDYLTKLYRQISNMSNRCNSKELEDYDDENDEYWNNKDKKIYGCEHYQRNCVLYFSCCNRWYVCCRCHDGSVNHPGKSDNISKIRCLYCNTIQSAISNKCEKCGIKFGNYYCEKCVLYENDNKKLIYHCDKCGLCRLGDKSKYIHCDRCEGCVLKECHSCIESNCKSKCPICFDEVFESRETIIQLKCGHIIHKECLDEYMKTNYVCPLCCKSIYDASEYYKTIDEYLKNEEELPGEFNHMKNEIYCNDCEKKSIVKFHFVYHKCIYCNGYNTKVIHSLGRQSSKCFDDNENDHVSLGESINV